MKLLYSIHKYDVFMFNWLFNSAIHSALVKTSRSISRTADGPLYALIAGVLYWQFGADTPLLKVILLGFAMERPLYFVLKNVLRRNRPAAAIPNFTSIITPSDKFSFPSGHTSAAFMMASLLGFFFPVLMIPLYVWASLVGCSRVVLGVHFPTDILVGVMLGVGTALISLGQI